jgi:prevent-host-death family protein
MHTIISIHEARNHLSELIQQAHYLGKPFVLTRGKKPMVAIIGIQEFGRILELIELYDPALADTMALMANPDIENVLKQGEEAIQKGELVPFDTHLIDA